jgi:hypothetical protein
MTIDTTGLGAPVTDLDDYLAARPRPACIPDRDVARTPGADDTPRTTRLRWALIPLAFLAVAGAFAVGRSFGSDPILVPAAAPLETAAARGLDGFAELYVATYLAASGPERAAALARFGPGLDAANDPGPDARYVVRTASVRSSPIGDDYWSVLVGAEVLYRTEAGFVPGGLEYYEVAVADVDAGMIATAPPLPAAAPVVPVPYGTYVDLRRPADEATVAFITEFVQAYFLGGEQLPRYVVADAGITPPSPAAAADVVTVHTEDVDGATWATATVMLTDADGHTLSTAITVRLVVDRVGGLRVAAVLPGPPPLPPAP